MYVQEVVKKNVGSYINCYSFIMIRQHILPDTTQAGEQEQYKLLTWSVECREKATT